MGDKRVWTLFALPPLVLGLLLGVAQWQDRAKVINMTIGHSPDVNEGAFLALRMLSEEVKAYPNAEIYIVRRGCDCGEGNNELITEFDRQTGRFHDDYVCQGSSVDWGNIRELAIHALATQSSVFKQGSYQLWSKYGGVDISS